MSHTLGGCPVSALRRRCTPAINVIKWDIFPAGAGLVEKYNRKFFAIIIRRLEARFVVAVILTPGASVDRLASTR